MNIKELIILTIPTKTIIEDSTHIEFCDKFNNCKICGGTSGTLKIITHLYYKQNGKIIPCIYKIIDTDYYTPIIIGNYNKSRSRIDSNIAQGLLQREYALINSDNSTKIIGSYGAGPCIIMCLRNRITTLTFLCHLDLLTIDYKHHFYKFEPNDTDVYIIGCDRSTIHILHKLLTILDNMNFKITFAHVIDDILNSFAINTVTGDIYLNEELFNPLNNLPIKSDYKYRYNRMLSFLLLHTSYLFKVNFL